MLYVLVDALYTSKELLLSGLLLYEIKRVLSYVVDDLNRVLMEK